MQQNNFIGFLSLLTTSILFGSYGLWIRVLSSALNTYQQIALRYILGSLFLLLIIFIKKEKASFKNISKLHLAVFSFSIPISFIFFNFAMLQAKLSVATVGFYLGTILLGSLLGVLVFKEKLTIINIFSLLSALAGFAFFLMPFSCKNLNLGFICGILSGIIYGIASTFKKYLRGKISRLWLVEISAIATVLFMLPFIFLNQAPSPQVLSIKVFLTACIFAIIVITAEFLSVVGFQNFDLNWASVILSGEIIFAGLIGYIFYQETLSGVEIIGILFITLAILLPHLNSLVKSKQKALT